MKAQSLWPAILAIPALPLLGGCAADPAVHTSVSASVAIREAPPLIPFHEQPPCPAEGYVWVPGYWSYATVGYYWVPGVWVLPPQVGLLWTPGYWSFVTGGSYVFHEGYWGARVGYYGGIDYGGGYSGSGYRGGRWVGGVFHYNTAVTNVNVSNVHNVYHETIVNNVTINRIGIRTDMSRLSYSGGPKGARSQLNAEERAAAGEAHVPPTVVQVQHRQQARERFQLRPPVVQPGRVERQTEVKPAPPERGVHQRHAGEERDDARAAVAEMPAGETRAASAPVQRQHLEERSRERSMRRAPAGHPGRAEPRSEVKPDVPAARPPARPEARKGATHEPRVGEEQGEERREHSER